MNQGVLRERVTFSNHQPPLPWSQQSQWCDHLVLGCPSDETKAYTMLRSAILQGNLLYSVVRMAWNVGSCPTADVIDVC
jgi:hypothetical protein